MGLPLLLLLLLYTTGFLFYAYSLFIFFFLFPLRFFFQIGRLFCLGAYTMKRERNAQEWNCFLLVMTSNKEQKPPFTRDWYLNFLIDRLLSLPFLQLPWINREYWLLIDLFFFFLKKIFRSIIYFCISVFPLRRGAELEGVCSKNHSSYIKQKHLVYWNYWKNIYMCVCVYFIKFYSLHTFLLDYKNYNYTSFSSFPIFPLMFPLDREEKLLKKEIKNFKVYHIINRLFRYTGRG